MMGNRISAIKWQAQKAFTLVELVVGMVVISIAFVLLSTMLFPQAERAADTLHRVRSAELAHSILNEIWGKRYDQNSNANGGVPACGAPAKPAFGLPAGLPCTTPANLGPDTVAGVTETRNDYNDVDDYTGLNIGSDMLNSSETYADRYINYGLEVLVAYNNLPSLNTKLITINVTTPNGEVMSFNAIRSNY
ncbi:type II secretion system GspH family protein [Shewanella schlegeliana]|uniref:Type II secretion system protein n=1 Tax=Shewanella schlegeliana TaxID=190308 RepID=A0ABS1SZM3_9GAMM|nr:type II secretion system protein [Shewanella schlegeliana]MBL4913007.1 type II secretion system protein [Shewanella schlegeliana]MCL1108897.1 type II secretion system GspH family protein [Shewanella schlegeliana]GIU23784.1 MSHA biogenesis protein MshD [Shewanella schlegeliana]